MIFDNFCCKFCENVKSSVLSQMYFKNYYSKGTKRRIQTLLTFTFFFFSFFLTLSLVTIKSSENSDFLKESSRHIKVYILSIGKG